MSAPEAADTLSLPPQVDASVAAALYRSWSTRIATLRCIDLSAVGAIDSAGVALVRALQSLARRRAGLDIALRGRPARYDQLCLAHRLDPTRN